jgi:hypothetical protein
LEQDVILLSIELALAILLLLLFSLVLFPFVALDVRGPLLLILYSERRLIILSVVLPVDLLVRRQRGISLTQLVLCRQLTA